MPYDLPDFIEAKISPEPNSGCWLWTGSIDGRNYGRVRLGHGPVSDALVIDHLCRNTFCVNPQHLEPVTEKENILRGVGASATNARKRFCDNGHSLDAAYVVSGSRKCRQCQLDNMAKYYQRKKQSALLDMVRKGEL